MVRLIHCALVVCIASHLAFAPMLPSAVAQDQAGSAERARRLFKEGLALAESERWAEALSAFRRSAELVPRGSTSYNIANALYRLDRPVEALVELDSYERMIEVHADDAAWERGVALRELLEGAVAEVRLSITPMDAKVFVNGRPSASIGSARTLRLNPGTHSIRAIRGGYAPFRGEIRVERGAQQVYTVTLQALAPAASSTITVSQSSLSLTPDEGGASAPSEDDRKPFVKRPGFWVMIGVVAAAGIGTGVAIALVRKDDAPPCGTTGNCATTQGLTVRSF